MNADQFIPPRETSFSGFNEVFNNWRIEGVRRVECFQTKSDRIRGKVADSFVEAYVYSLFRYTFYWLPTVYEDCEISFFGVDEGCSLFVFHFF